MPLGCICDLKEIHVFVVSILITIEIVAVVFQFAWWDEGITLYCPLEFVIVDLFIKNVVVKFAYKFTEKIIFVTALEELIHFQCDLFLWFVGCFGLNGSLRQYFSLYRTSPSEREKEERNDRREKKMSKTTVTRTYSKHIRPMPYYNQN